ncbi:MAG: excisionase family DNA-binding protein [Myxococcota bacterium]
MPSEGGQKKRRAFLTTHQAARLFNVSLPTIVNWIDAGKMDAHRTPGGHRRIARKEIIRFARAFSVPLPDSFLGQSGPTRILIVESDIDLGDTMRGMIQVLPRVEVQVASGAFEAGYLLGSFEPQVVLLDTKMPGLDPSRVVSMIRSTRDGDDIKVLACSSGRDSRQATLLREFDGRINKPIDWRLFQELMKESLG